ncbi:MAG: tyrosine-type recombinase/integrase [Candidatus Zapsychrus exili]|nr:tyrosine-type recombinase/integrase [Candidatus Zapsychrus exili]
MKQNCFNFTKQALLSLKPLSSHRLIYHDAREKGLCLYITIGGVKTFFIRRRVNKRDEKIILGRFPETSIEQARKGALKAKGEVVQGINPNDEKRKLKQNITLGAFVEEYSEKYAKNHNKSWEKNGHWLYKKYLSNWENRCLDTIKKYDVEKLHHYVGDKNGKCTANRVLTLLVSLFNRATEWGFTGENPAKGIRKYKEKSRDRFIQPEELPRFFKALNEESNETVRDYIWLSVLTGARKANVLSMNWDEINFKRRIWSIPETKNGEPLDLPLVDEAVAILKTRTKSSESEWVFPSLTSESGHLEEPKKIWRRVLEKAKISNLRIHDIRRTLGSYQAIVGSSLHIIGKSLGHKSQQTTQIYARLNDDPVRQSLDKAIKVILNMKEENEKEEK